MSHNDEYGKLVTKTQIDGYSVDVCVSNQEPEKQGNNVVVQLMQSFEERKNTFDNNIDYIKGTRYN